MSQVFDNLEGYADYYYSRYRIVYLGISGGLMLACAMVVRPGMGILLWE